MSADDSANEADVNEKITDLFRLLQQIPKEKRGKSLDLIQNCTLLIKDDESKEQTSQLRGHLDSQVESKKKTRRKGFVKEEKTEERHAEPLTLSDEVPKRRRAKPPKRFLDDSVEVFLSPKSTRKSSLPKTGQKNTKSVECDSSQMNNTDTSILSMAIKLEPVDEKEILEEIIVKRPRGRPKKTAKLPPQTKPLDENGQETNSSSQSVGKIDECAESKEESGGEPEVSITNNNENVTRNTIKLRHLKVEKNEHEPDCQTVKRKRGRKKGSAEQKQPQCDVCERYLSTQQALVLHMRIHTGEEPYTCEICGKSFKQSGSLTWHKKKDHLNEKPKQCSLCDFKCLYKHDLLRHIRRSHTLERPFLCDTCGKDFFTKRNLINHANVHRKRDLSCDMCDFKTHSISCMASHIRNIHRERELHTCEICGTQLRYLESYRVHMSRHYGKKPFTCEECGAKFTTSSQKMQHMRIHRERCQTCEVCKKKFLTKHHLTRHMFIHSGDKPHGCPDCPYTCNVKANLRKHCISVHKKVYPPVRSNHVRLLDGIEVPEPKPKAPRKSKTNKSTHISNQRGKPNTSLTDGKRPVSIEKSPELWNNVSRQSSLVPQNLNDGSHLVIHQGHVVEGTIAKVIWPAIINEPSPDVKQTEEDEDKPVIQELTSAVPPRSVGIAPDSTINYVDIGGVNDTQGRTSYIGLAEPMYMRSEPTCVSVSEDQDVQSSVHNSTTTTMTTVSLDSLVDPANTHYNTQLAAEQVMMILKDQDRQEIQNNDQSNIGLVGHVDWNLHT